MSINILSASGSGLLLWSEQQGRAARCCSSSTTPLTQQELLSDSEAFFLAFQNIEAAINAVVSKQMTRYDKRAPRTQEEMPRLSFQKQTNPETLIVLFTFQKLDIICRFISLSDTTRNVLGHLLEQ